jgi:hypothetical protein
MKTDNFRPFLRSLPVFREIYTLLLNTYFFSSISFFTLASLSAMPGSDLKR